MYLRHDVVSRLTAIGNEFSKLITGVHHGVVGDLAGQRIVGLFSYLTTWCHSVSDSSSQESCCPLTYLGEPIQFLRREWVH